MECFEQVFSQRPCLETFISSGISPLILLNLCNSTRKSMFLKGVCTGKCCVNCFEHFAAEEDRKRSIRFSKGDKISALKAHNRCLMDELLFSIFDRYKDNSSQKIISLTPIYPFILSEEKDLFLGKRYELFVKLITVVDSIDVVGQTVIDWIDDADTGKKYLDAVPAETMQSFNRATPLSFMRNHLATYFQTNSREFSISPPWGTFSTSINSSLLEPFIPQGRRLRVQCYNLYIHLFDEKEDNTGFISLKYE